MAYIYGPTGSPVLSGYWPWAAAAAAPSGILLLYGYDGIVGVYDTSLERLFSGTGTLPEETRASASAAAVWLAGAIDPSPDVTVFGYDGNGVVDTFTVTGPGGQFLFSGAFAINYAADTVYVGWLNFDGSDESRVYAYDVATQTPTLFWSGTGRMMIACPTNALGASTDVYIGERAGTDPYTLTVYRYSAAGSLLSTSDPISDGSFQWNLAVKDPATIFAIGQTTITTMPLNLSTTTTVSCAATAEDMACVIPVTFEGPWESGGGDDVPATPTPGEDYPVKWMRVAPQGVHELQRVFYGRFELLVDVGTGDDLNPNPTVSMSYSDNGGKTWSAWRERRLGNASEVNQRVFWQPCGSGRDRVWRIYGASSAPLGLVDAYVQILGGTS